MHLQAKHNKSMENPSFLCIPQKPSLQRPCYKTTVQTFLGSMSLTLELLTTRVYGWSVRRLIPLLGGLLEVLVYSVWNKQRVALAPARPIAQSCEGTRLPKVPRLSTAVKHCFCYFPFDEVR